MESISAPDYSADHSALADAIRGPWGTGRKRGLKRWKGRDKLGSPWDRLCTYCVLLGASARR